MLLQPVLSDSELNTNQEEVSIESWFFQTAVDTKSCSLEPVRGKEPCPEYYKLLATAADWHVVTAVFAVALVFMFVGAAFEKRE